MPEKPKSILRNAPLHYKENTLDDYDRNEVLSNTFKNSELFKGDKGDKIRNLLNGQKNIDPDQTTINTAGIEWDEAKLSKTEAEKNSTMKIDEPKTPYQGAVDPTNDYYRTDNESDLDEFKLGESEFDDEYKGSLELNESSTIEPSHEVELEVEENVNQEDDNGNEQEIDEDEDEATKKHRKFEEMRKSHYAGKGNVLKHKIAIPDEDEE